MMPGYCLLPAMLAAWPAFDVASVKAGQFTPGQYRANLGTAGHGEVMLANVTLSSGCGQPAQATLFVALYGPADRSCGDRSR